MPVGGSYLLIIQYECSYLFATPLRDDTRLLQSSMAELVNGNFTGTSMKKLKAVSSVLVISLFLQGIAPSYGAQVYELSEIDTHVTSRPAAFTHDPEAQQPSDGSGARRWAPRVGKKFWIAMGTLLFVGIAGGVLGALKAKGVFDPKSEPANDPVNPAVPTPTLPHSNNITSIHFSGYDWPVKQGGKENRFAYTDDAIFIDGAGNLNLKVLKDGDAWKSSEVSLGHSLGYGTYEFEIKTSGIELDPALVSSSMIYQDDQNILEVGLSKWKEASPEHTASFAVQPSDVPGNIYPFQPVAAEDGFVKYRINWSKEKVLFEALVKDAVIASFSYSGKYNFAPGNETVVLKHWLFNTTAPSDQNEHSLVIKSFGFKPLQ